MGKKNSLLESQLSHFEENTKLSSKERMLNKSSNTEQLQAQLNNDALPDYVKLKISRKLRKFHEISKKNEKTIQGHVQFL
ncbi:MAG: hypothetical protein P8I94_03300, partial [Emcibacteraceae bacterium]|nr:hypothetical protein [Emcibacteraceae bacterium]